MKRRAFLRNSLLFGGCCTWSTHGNPGPTPPRLDPLEHLQIPWTREVRWDQGLDISQLPGTNWDHRLEQAQELLASRGGGVVYFPAGEYTFYRNIRLRDRIILRGDDPRGSGQAREADYHPPTRFLFPVYKPTFTGSGTPIDRAFKGIRLADPARARETGVVNIAIQRGHIHLSEGTGHRCGDRRIVFGCHLTHTAVADPEVPDLELGQLPWQRFTQRHFAAIDIKGQDVIVANNRLPASDNARFVQPGFRLKGRRTLEAYDVEFDYDNRPGLYVNHTCIGGAGGSGNDGTPSLAPYGFRTGMVIADNYIYNTGRTAIGFCGDGVLCARNTIRFARDVWRPTATGRQVTSGSSTNDNRAIEMRGWRWVVADNDYEVYRNWAADRKYLINDGEGLMHEDHCNSTILDSRLERNRGNSYVSIYKCGSINGLQIQENDISSAGRIDDLYIVADRNSGRQPCRRTIVANNITRTTGIRMAGSPASGNMIEGNRHLGETPGTIINQADAQTRSNHHYLESPG